MKKSTKWIHIKRFLKKNDFVRKIFVPIYRSLKFIKRNIYSEIKDWLLAPNLPNPEKIYWINPKTIIYHTNYRPDTHPQIEDRVFDMSRQRGAVMDGDWDLPTYKFEDLAVFKAFKTRIKENKSWTETLFYQNLLKDINQGYIRFSCANESELADRFQALDSLVDSIKNNGYNWNKDIISKKKTLNSKKNIRGGDEVTVNIGRNGEYLFQNGRHRLAIALLLEIEKIPVQVLVRHKDWIRLRNKLLAIAEISGGVLYQPALHHDLSDIPAAHDCIDRFEAIKDSLTFFEGSLLDVGANLGYFCHRFEELGFDCIGIEKDIFVAKAAEGIRKSVGKNFKIVTGDVLDPALTNVIGQRFDIVLFLNILHHFLKVEKAFEEMTRWLNKLEVRTIFFEPHLSTEKQMKNAYLNFSNTEFLDYIMKNTGKTNSEPIHKSFDGRTLYMLT